MSWKEEEIKCSLLIKEGSMSFDYYYYHVYLKAHKKKGTRIMHLMGVFFTLVCFLASLWFNSVLLLILTPLVVYPFAWTSHLLIEKNRPLAWTSPWAAKLADLRMCREMVMGRLDWGE